MKKSLTKGLLLLLSLSALSIVGGNSAAVAEPLHLEEPSTQELFRDTPTQQQTNLNETTPLTLSPVKNSPASLSADATEPAPTLTAEKLANRPQLSTSALDLTPNTTENGQLEAGVPNNTTYEIAQIRRRTVVPGSNFVGAGFSFGAGRDVLDFTVFSKFQLLQFPSDDPVASLSVRPSIGFGSQLDIRVPVTVEPRMAVFDANDPTSRFSPFAGLGAAITVDDGEADFNVMLTGGADFLLTRQLTLTGMANLLFLSDVELEGQVGIAYNF
ncbi:hypothetical protein NG798_06340 [Ancylothrix sp. C2]|uniref:hypothetical protein n=1 Tax=Ancylothrix sp. D3o TaxID=2953691 RepID=UPI0021BB6B9F|nr:hypothetical protein [Ancylothrix sp. D3o]MCT7949398.1 hypothetical protein [Ancylothrix sp. D3o]